jgi:hypothetical protein
MEAHTHTPCIKKMTRAEKTEECRMLVETQNKILAASADHPFFVYMRQIVEACEAEEAEPQEEEEEWDDYERERTPLSQNIFGFVRNAVHTLLKSPTKSYNFTEGDKQFIHILKGAFERLFPGIVCEDAGYNMSVRLQDGYEFPAWTHSFFHITTGIKVHYKTFEASLDEFILWYCYKV